MKKRYLRPSIQNALTGITMILMMMCAVDNYLDVNFIDFLLYECALISLIILNCVILHKYGRWEND